MPKKKLNKTTPLYLHPLIWLTFLWGVGFYYFKAIPLLFDPDTSWHIMAGTLIREQGAVPATNPWAFTALDTAWYNLSWLWDVTLSVIFSAVGNEGLFAFIVLFYALILTLLATTLLARKDIPANAIGFTIFLATFALWEFQSARPHSVTYLMLIIFYAILSHYKRHLSIKYLVLLPFLMLAWVNSHGGFFTGFILLGIFGLEAIIEKDWRRTFILASIGTLCLITIPITPLGFDIKTAVFRSLDSNITGYIDEWKPYTLGKYISSSIWLITFILVSNIREPKIPLADKMLAFFWLFAALLSYRNMPIFALMATPYVAQNLARTGILRTFPEISSIKKLRLLALGIIVIVGLWLSTPIKQLYPVDRIGHRPHIAEGIQFLQDNCSGKRILNSYEMGTDIIYYSQGNFPVFIDGRAGTAYNEEVMNDYTSLFTYGKRRNAILEKYYIDGIVTLNDHPFFRLFGHSGKENERWVKQFTNQEVTIFAKKGTCKK